MEQVSKTYFKTNSFGKLIASFVVCATICVFLVDRIDSVTELSQTFFQSIGPAWDKVFMHRHLQDEPHFRMLQSNTQGGHFITPGHHFNHSSTHRRAWMHLKEVDGLKNEDVVMVITSTSVKEGYLLRERIIASSRTWLRGFANAVVVIEDNFDVRFAMRHCETLDYERYTAFNCHNEPTYLLSRECTNEYYGAAGPCCKVDDAFNYIINVRKDLFSHLKYVLHCDDDMYWRPDQVLRWLASVENSGAGQYPLVANLQFGDDRNAGVWMINGCQEIHTTGWYQPLMLNKAALEKMAVAVSKYGIRDTCKAFDVTHDIGVGVFAWLFGTIHVQLPNTNPNGQHHGIKAFRPDDMAMHYVKHGDKDRCDGRGDNGWPAADRFRQNVVIGCGDIGQDIVNHHKEDRADMYDAWDYYRQHGKNITLNKAGVNEYHENFVVVRADGTVRHILMENSILTPEADGSFKSSNGEVSVIDEITKYKLQEGEKIVRKVVPRLMPLRGYSTTKHSKENDITKEWKQFLLTDCNPPGAKSK